MLECWVWVKQWGETAGKEHHLGFQSKARCKGTGKAPSESRLGSLVLVQNSLSGSLLPDTDGIICLSGSLVMDLLTFSCHGLCFYGERELFSSIPPPHAPFHSPFQTPNCVVCCLGWAGIGVLVCVSFCVFLFFNFFYPVWDRLSGNFNNVARYACMYINRDC